MSNEEVLVKGAMRNALEEIFFSVMLARGHVSFFESEEGLVVNLIRYDLWAVSHEIRSIEVLLTETGGMVEMLYGDQTLLVEVEWDGVSAHALERAQAWRKAKAAKGKQ